MSPQLSGSVRTKCVYSAWCGMISYMVRILYECKDDIVTKQDTNVTGSRV